MKLLQIKIKTALFFIGFLTFLGILACSSGGNQGGSGPGIAGNSSEGPQAYVISSAATADRGATSLSGNHNFSVISVVTPDEKLMACLVQLQEQGVGVLQSQTNLSFLFLLESGFDPYTIPSLCGADQLGFSFVPANISRSQTSLQHLYLDYDYIYLPQEIQNDISKGTPYFMVVSSNAPGVPPYRILPAFKSSGFQIIEGEYVFHVGFFIEEINAHEDLQFRLFKQTAADTFEFIPSSLGTVPDELPAYLITIDTDVHFVAKRLNEMPYDDCLESDLDPYFRQSSIGRRINPLTTLFLLKSGADLSETQLRCNWSFPGYELNQTYPTLPGSATVSAIDPVTVTIDSGVATIDPAFQAGVNSWSDYMMIATFSVPNTAWDPAHVFLFNAWDPQTQSGIDGTYDLNYFAPPGSQWELSNLYFVRYFSPDRVEIIPININRVP